MKKFAVTLMVLLCMIVMTSCGGKGETLYVYNWGDYIDMEVIEQFEKETGIKVVYDTFDSNESMYVKVKATPDAYDILFPSDYMIERMMNEGMLQKINWTNVPNIANINPLFKTTNHDPNGEYFAAYMWGTVGILYNTTMVDDPVDSWNILWDQKYSKQIFMYDSVRDGLAVSLKKLGYSLNTASLEEVNAAKNDLIAQKPLVQAYLIDQIKDKMIGNEGALAVVYSGDALYCKQFNDDLEYVIPNEGSNLWYDGMVIPKEAKNVKNAEKFIDFMCRPEIAAMNSEYIEFSTANIPALDLVPEELRDNYIYNPGEEEILRCEMYNDIGDMMRIYNDAWTEVLNAK